MLYKGTKKRDSKQISEEIEKKGGILNGFTDEEVTAYWCKMPAKHIEVALEVLSDMVSNPLFEEAELNKERQVILEEMKMRRDRPDWYVADKIQGMLFTGNLGLDLIGTEKSLKSINREVILKKFQEIYKTKNIFLVVVGDADFEQICTFCEKNFKKSSGIISEPKIGFKNSQKIETREGIDQANLIFAYHTANATKRENYAAQILSTILAGGMSSRLFQEIREKRNLAYAVKGSCNSGKRFGFNGIYIGTKKENVEEVKKLILEEIKKLEKELDENELNQAKEQLRGNSSISREDSQGEMLDLLFNEIWDKAENSYDYEKNIEQVRLEEVKKIAASVKEGNYSFVALVPK